MQFTYTISMDDDYEPWGDPAVITETTDKIVNGVWAAYIVTVRAAGPVESEESTHGCVVPLTDTGAYRDPDAIPDAHLRDTARDMAKRIASEYLDLLTAKRAEIDAMIQQMGGA